MLTFFPWDRTKALVKALSSVFCAEVSDTSKGLGFYYLVCGDYHIPSLMLAVDHETAPVCIQLPGQCCQWLVQQTQPASINLVNDFQALMLEGWAPSISGSRVAGKMSQLAATAQRQGGQPYIVWSISLRDRLWVWGCFPESELVPPVRLLPFMNV